MWFWLAAGMALATEAVVVTTDTPITVDGVLDEPVWSEAVPVTAFLKFQPTEGGAPAGTTEVRFAADDLNLYVAIRVEDSGYPIRARTSPREAINADDQIGIYLDTFLDGRTGYIFYLNPLGIQQDIRHNNGNWNPSWNTSFRSRGIAEGEGFTLEVAFPWRSLKYPRGVPEQTWGLILTRKIPSEGAKYGWPDIERNHPRMFTQAGTLTGVKPPPSGSGLELIPSLTVGHSWPSEEVDTRPALERTFDIVRPSLDARFGITPDVSLTGTVNPDFSQVESDVSDIRLNARFAFRFPETRPFFLDGSEFFRDRQDTLYTRSMEEPISGIKVAGREGGWSIGALNVLDRSPLPSVNENPTPGFEDADVADRWAVNTAARVAREAFGSGLVGLTLVDKRVVGSPDRSGAGASHQAAGTDAIIPLGGRWTLGGSTLQTLTGDGQQGPMWGQGNELGINRASGIGTGMALWGTDQSIGYRKEAGFLTQSGQSSVGGMVDHAFVPESGVLDTVKPSLETTSSFARNGELFQRVGSRVAWIFDGIHRPSFGGGWTRQKEGPPIGTPLDPPAGWTLVEEQGWWADAAYNGQLGAALEVAPRGSFSRGLDFARLVPAHALDTSLTATVRATTGLRIDLTGSLQRLWPEGSEVEQSNLVRSRINWQFTRELGLRIVEEHVSGTAFEAPQLSSSALLTWLKVPGTAAYLGYGQSAVLGQNPEVLEHTVFMKASILLRP
jgi:hypothetical protein